MPSARPRRRGFIILAIILLAFASLSLARFYTDVLWFSEVGFSSVLFKSLTTQFVVGLAAGLFVAALVWVNLRLVARFAPPYRLTRVEGRDDPIERYRELLAPYLGWLRLAVAGIVGLLAGIGASSMWPDFLLWANRVEFGTTDPQFGRDLGFYVFELPFLKHIAGFLWFAFMVALVISAVAHYFHGAIRPEVGLRGLSPSVLAHLSVLLGCLALIKAAQYYLGTFELNLSARGVVTGASYTDVNAHLPALRLLAIISIISAVLFLVNIRFRRVSLPIAAVGIWIGFALVVGGLWPALIQRFSVEPQELRREEPFIQRNIAATRAGFGLGDVAEAPFPAATELAAEDVEGNDTLLQNVRLWDPAILQRAYTQLQAIRPYYSFEDVDVDRYEINGQIRQVLLSARELSLTDLPDNSKTWPNLHLQFTHGYGIVASFANDATEAGQPEFLVQDIPGTVESGAESLNVEQGGLYFGESFEPFEYSIVNTRQDELDFETETETQRSNYAGDGGVRLNNLFKRAAFAVREFDWNVLISQEITSESKIMLYRDVRDRVLRAAPFLALDSDPYPVVSGDRVVWILDAYTTSEWYPYSERFALDGMVVRPELAGTLTGNANYVRNSVKVVVDAYNGSMDFYVVDESDPVIQAWQSAFPDLFTDEEPPEEIAAHFRYPEDLFKVQSEVYLSYHIDSAADFYAHSDEWGLARNVLGHTGSVARAETVPPTYLLISLPGETDQEFVLTRPFTPRGRNNMVALMVARSDPENYGEMMTLEFPRSRQVPGPLQIDNLINQDFDISQALTLLRQGGSSVDFGTLVILPLDDAIVYVQPLFVTAAEEGIPELKRVIVVFGEEVVMEETFDAALAGLFGLEEPVPEGPGGEPLPEEPGQPPAGGDRQLAEVVDRAGQVYAEAQEALQDGDFERYGLLIERLGRLLQEAEDLSGP